MPSTSTSVIDGLSTSLAVKAPCKAVATSNIALSGEKTVGTVACVEGDRVLVTAQTNTADNGIYDVSTGDWTRSQDADGNRDMVGGTRVIVKSSSGFGTEYELTTDGDIVIGTTALVFQLRYGANATYDRTQAEISAGITPSDTTKTPNPVDLQRYGILPNNIAFAANNTTRLIALLDPTKTGPQGDFEFYPVIGNDTYHFNDVIQIRDNCRFKLNGCRILFTKTAAVADQTMGLFTMKTGVTFENGTIEGVITGTVGGNACALARVGSRSGYKFGAYTAGIFDKTDLADNGLAPQGACTFRNIKFKSNNPYANCAFMVVGFGGIRDVLFEQTLFEGSGTGGPGTGFYYEMGDADNGGDPSHTAKWHTSHAINLQLRQIRGKNLNTVGVGSDDAVVSIVGANDCTIDGVYGESCNSVVAVRLGESHYKNAWAPDQTAGPRIMRIHGARCGPTVVGSAILVNGEGVPTGQFSDANCIAAGVAVMTLQEKLDLIRCEITGFDLNIAASGNGIVANCPVMIRGGNIRGGTSGIFLQGDCSFFDIHDTNIYDTNGPGIRADSDSTLKTLRRKRGRISNCKVKGSIASQAISLNYVDGVLVENNELGYMLARGDAADEVTQTFGVLVAGDGLNVLCRNNNVKTSGGAAAYSLAAIAGTDESGGSGIVNPIGNLTFTGKWRGVQQAKTVTLSFATPGDIAIVYTQQIFEYVRSIEGDRVDFSLRIETSTFTHTTTAGAASIGNLPYVVNAAGFGRCAVALAYQGITKAGYSQVMAETIPGAATMSVVASGSAQTLATLAAADFPTAGNVILRGAGHYFV